SYSPDGSQAVNFVFGGKRVRLQRADGTRRALPVKGDYSFMRGASWSRDGRSLVVQTEVEGVATLWNVGVGGSQRRLIEERARISSAQFAPRGEGILYLRLRTLDAWDLIFLPVEDGRASGAPRVAIEGIGRRSNHKGVVPAFIVTADGRHLVY